MSRERNQIVASQYEMDPIGIFGNRNVVDKKQTT